MVAITIMLVDNHLLMLDGMKRILEDVADFKVTAAFQDGIAAIEHLKKHKMDIVLMNTQLPGQSGLETCRMITRKYSSTRVIMLTNDSNDFHLQQAIRAGAKGYLSKSIDSQELMEAIYSVYRKGAMVPLFAVPQTLRRATKSGTIAPFLYTL